jgi:hypothetical protein
MKHLKRFENFDLGRFSEADSDEQEWLDHVKDINDDEMDFELEDEEDSLEDEEENMEEEREMRRKVWGDEVVEGLSAKQKKLPKALQDAILKRKGKKVENKKENKEDKKEDKEDKENKKGLTAGQRKLPKALQDSILKKK